MKNVSSTSSFSLNEYYESARFFLPHGKCYSSSSAKQKTLREEEDEAGERCGNGKNTSNYIENMIILCRFLCFRFIKPFCRYTSPSSCYTHAQLEGRERRTMEMLRVRSWFGDARCSLLQPCNHQIHIFSITSITILIPLIVIAHCHPSRLTWNADEWEIIMLSTSPIQLRVVSLR